MNQKTKRQSLESVSRAIDEMISVDNGVSLEDAKELLEEAQSLVETLLAGIACDLENQS